MPTRQTVRVLLVGDNEDGHAHVRRMLTQAESTSYDLTCVAGHDEAREALRGRGYDVGLLGDAPGVGAGLRLLAEAAGAGCPAPLILLTGRADRAMELAALKAGAADCLPEDRLTADLLERSIRYALERHRAEQRLRLAQKMEAVGRLAGGIAHDFNNLMTVVGGYSEVLLNMLPADHAGRGPAGEIKKAQERCAVLTRQLLAFGHKQRLALRQVNPNAVLTGMAGMLQALLGPGVKLQFDLGTDVARLWADQVQIERVILNLAANARDAMPQGGRLTIATANVDLSQAEAIARPGLRPGAYVLLRVTDTGFGMDEQTLARAFEPYFTTKGPARGSGLGLATVRGIVEQSAGHVYADSTPGEGTSLLVYFPRHDLDPRADAAGDEMVRPEGRKTILVVDGEEAVRVLVRQALECQGYAVLEASDAREALAACGRHAGPIHLLLTDEVTGAGELAARLAGGRPSPKVLYFSEHAPDAVGRPAGPHNPAAFLAKPFAVTELSRKVREVLAGVAD
jgi:signal transduction histidine kinase